MAPPKSPIRPGEPNPARKLQGHHSMSSSCAIRNVNRNKSMYPVDLIVLA
jgi:hypothetical protein